MVSKIWASRPSPAVKRHRAAKSLTKVQDHTYRTSFGLLVETMSNKQRNSWARAGYPGLRNKEAEAVLPFLPEAARKAHKTPRKRRAKREHS